MFNPLKKVAAMLGLTSIAGSTPAPFQNFGSRGRGGSKFYTTTPMHMRKADRRRKNKLARAARRLNRS